MDLSARFRLVQDHGCDILEPRMLAFVSVGLLCNSSDQDTSKFDLDLMYCYVASTYYDVML
jgi:hypothetical protein